MTTKNQIDLLASFIVEEIPGEPSQSEGAGDCAIRLLRKYREAMNEAMHNIGVPGEGYPANIAEAYDLLETALK